MDADRPGGGAPPLMYGENEWSARRRRTPSVGGSRGASGRRTGFNRSGVGVAVQRRFGAGCVSARIAVVFCRPSKCSPSVRMLADRSRNL